MKQAVFHLPGLFEFYELYRLFLPLFREHREYFYDWCRIGSLYGAPGSCLWGGGRVGCEARDIQGPLALCRAEGISARLTFSNSLLEPRHLDDPASNALCRSLNAREGNGVILHSELLLQYLQTHYPNLCRISSTTKVLTRWQDFLEEVDREAFSYVVPDFRLNKDFRHLETLTPGQRAKVEFLCNECCDFGCTQRRACYENVSRKNLGLPCRDHVCTAPHGDEGYRFSRAMENPGFISIQDIQETYLPMGFENFKLEGRGLGSAMVLEFLLYYLTKPQYQLHVREAIYLDSMLDLF